MWRKRTLVDIRKDTTLSNSYIIQKLAQLRVAADSKLEVTGGDSGFFEVTSGVTGQLEDVGGEVLEHGGKIYASADADTRSVVALAQETMDTANCESETGPGGAAAGCKSAIVDERNDCCRCEETREKVRYA
jgi:hypothetical protein